MSDVDKTNATSPATGTVGGVQKYSGLAIASLVLGIVGVFNFGVTSLVGLILGIIGNKQIKENPDQYKGAGMGLAGIITSAVALGLGVLFGILMVLATAASVAAEM